MSQDIRDFVTPSCELLAFGEPTHQEPAFPLVRNELFGQLAGHGFRSIALETDRVAALIVNDFVQEGAGTLDAAMSEGFSHGFGDLDANRRLVAWMRAYNESWPAEQRLAFHGFDAATENMSAPSPRSYLEYARDYLKLDLDFTGDDERWSRTEAILDPVMSIGDTTEAERLRTVADDMFAMLYARAPELVAATSRAEWFRVETYLTAGIGLLRYHKQSAQRIEESARISGLLATRDALMAQNLIDIRRVEAGRGATLVFANNVHLQRNRSHMHMAGMDLTWWSAGAIVASLIDDQYTFVAGSLGRGEGPGPEADSWDLTTAGAFVSARTDTTPMLGYFPLDQATIDGADAVLHISKGTPGTESELDRAEQAGSS